MTDAEEEFNDIASWLQFCQGNTRSESERLAMEIINERD